MKMNKSKILVGAATLAAAVAGAGQQAQAATDNLKMSAVVLAPVDVTATATLDFGSLTVGTGAGGTVTVDTANGRTNGGTVNLVGGAAATSGAFTIKASIGKQVKVTVPATATVTHTTNAANQMTVNAFNINTNAGGRTYTHNQVAATDTGIAVGATLNVAASQAPGTYTGTTTITAVYQ